jgi:hypothetical protein
VIQNGTIKPNSIPVFTLSTKNLFGKAYYLNHGPMKWDAFQSVKRDVRKKVKNPDQRSGFFHVKNVPETTWRMRPMGMVHSIRKDFMLRKILTVFLWITCPIFLNSSYGSDAPFQAGSENGTISAQGTPQEIEKAFIGPDGNPLPFEKIDEVLDFLRTAEIRRITRVPTGVTKPRQLLLERDGIAANAIFHDVHESDRDVRLDSGVYVKDFRDSYLNQVAAFEVGRLLGFTNIPPTVLREVDGKKGSVGLWIENTINEQEMSAEGRTPPKEKIPRINRIKDNMRVFDNLINNFDRNQTNMLYDSNWQLWFIDHTRAFGDEKRLPKPKELRRCSVSLWEKLQALDAGLLKRVVGPYIGERRVAAVMARRDKILSHLRKRMASEGKDAVLFHMPES